MPNWKPLSWENSRFFIQTVLMMGKKATEQGNGFSQTLHGWKKL